VGTHLPTGRRRPGTRPSRLVLALAGVLLLAGCSGQDLALPDPATDRGDYVSDLWLGAWVAALVVGVFVWGLMGWAVVRYRRRSDDEIPSQIRYHLPIEVLYTVAPIIIVAVLFFHTVDIENKVLDQPEDPDNAIQVIGQKWAWTFTYLDAGPDGESVYDVGAPDNPAELYLPVDESVHFDLESNDVIHSFWVPAFLYKLDVVPGRENTFTVTPTEEGEYPGRCSELCGVYHSRMLFTVHIVSRDDYDAHLQDLADAGQTGEPQLSEDISEIAGTEDEGAEE
jgi:cytochrome c oxidase subunit II